LEKTRLQKIISESGFCSRRKADELIAKNHVKVNGHPAKLGDRANPQRDVITVDGEKIAINKNKKYLYLMLNKPRGYVTTLEDEMGRKCVTELLSGVEERVYPIGRLDRNSEGLLLFTNDGDFANSIMHPSKHVSKTYRVTVRPDINDDQLIRMTEGIVIEGQRTMPATINVLTKQKGRVVIQMIIHEGKNRQVRKMCEAVGLEVARLKRTSVGPLKLGMLKPGAWRELSAEELRAIRNSIGKED